MNTSSLTGLTGVNKELVRRARRTFNGPLLAAALIQFPMYAYATDTPPTSAETVTELMTRDLIGASGKEILMITVSYLPGGASLPHRHDAQVFVYVLEGALMTQLKGGTPTTFQRGQTFYEGPNDVHQVSANASQTTPAKILVFMVKDKAKPASRDVIGKEQT